MAPTITIKIPTTTVSRRIYHRQNQNLLQAQEEEHLLFQDLILSLSSAVLLLREGLVLQVQEHQS